MKLRGALAAASLVASCGWKLPDPAPYRPDVAAQDASDDLARDVASEAAMDASNDLGSDAADVFVELGVDTATDRPDDLAQDAGNDADDAADATGMDATGMDAPADAADANTDAADANTDAPAELADAGADAATDIARDVAAEGATDAGSDGASDPADAALPSLRFLSLCLGAEHTCGVTVTNDVYCWGNNDDGQLGDGTLMQHSIATRTMAGIPVAEVSCGRVHTCARTTAGNLFCWGNNSEGQLGDGTHTSRSLPTVVRDFDRSVVRLALGGEFTCALLTDRSVRCWGNNADGQLGDGSTFSRPRQAYVWGLGTATAVFAGDRHACALQRERVLCGSSGADVSVLRCWGANDHGQLGDGTYMQRRINVAVTALNASCATTELPALGGDHTCARSGSTLYCFGANDRGQLGTTDRSDETLPTPVFETGVFTMNYVPSLGFAHTCARRDDGALRCTGANDRGQLGNGDRTDRLSLSPTLPPGEVTSIVSGAEHTCMLGPAGEVYCTGRNDFGQLGTGDLRDRVRAIRITP